MALKLVGVIFTIVGCGSVGFKIAANYRREERNLQQLLRILEYMQCELQYRYTSLPTLCRQIANTFKGSPGYIFMELATEIESQISPDASCCMKNIINKDQRLPPITKNVFADLGISIGKFDLNGQVSSIESVKDSCTRSLNHLRENKDARLRSYQTLSLCAGAALAILLI